MCSCKVNAIKPQINNPQKPITRGLDYSTDTLKEASETNPDYAYVIKHIPRTIKNVDEFIRSSGKEVSIEDREDMIQEAILASLEKTKLPNYSQLSNPTAAHNNAENSRLKQVQKEMEKQNPIASLPETPRTYTMEDCIAEVSGSKSVRRVINHIVSTLPLREEAIIRDRYGLDGDDPCTYKELSPKYGITPSAISHIEDKALMHLRYPTRANILKQEIFVSPNATLYSIQPPEGKK